MYILQQRRSKISLREMFWPPYKGDLQHPCREAVLVTFKYYFERLHKYDAFLKNSLLFKKPYCERKICVMMGIYF